MGWQAQSRAVGRWCLCRIRGAHLRLTTAGLFIPFALVLLGVPQSVEAQVIGNRRYCSFYSAKKPALSDLLQV